MEATPETIIVSIYSPSLHDMLADTSDPVEAASEYCNRFRELIAERFPTTDEVVVETDANLPGRDALWVDGEPVDDGHDCDGYWQAVMVEVAENLVTDWSWLTVV